MAKKKDPYNQQDPHNGPILRFALGLLAVVVIVVGGIGFGIYKLFH